MGMGELVVASTGHSLACPGRDVDQGGAPLDCLFHSELLVDFAEPAFVGDHRLVRFLVARNFGRLNGIATTCS
jgi:hypothetical protein